MNKREQVREIVRQARKRLGIPETEGYRTRQEPVPGTVFTRPVEVPTLDIDTVLSCIGANFTRPITRSQVARRFGVTPRRLSGVLQEFGLAFESHVRQLRLFRAKKLLSLIRRKLPPASRTRYIRQKVSEVLVKVGWEGGKESFRGAFKQQFGTTPQGYLIGILDMRMVNKKERKDAKR